MVTLTDGVLIGPRRVLRSVSVLQALRVGQVVCCAVEPPDPAAHGGINCKRLAPPIDVLAEARRLERVVQRMSAGARTTLLVGDEALGGSADLAIALLQARDGLTEVEATLRIGQLLPAASVHIA